MAEMTTKPWFFSLILLVFALMLLYFQRKQKQQWKSEKIEE